MKTINTPSLNKLYEQVKIWTLDPKVPLSDYEDFYSRYLLIDQFICENPNYFDSPLEYDEAFWISSFIHVRVLETINFILSHRELELSLSRFNRH